MKKYMWKGNKYIYAIQMLVPNYSTSLPIKIGITSYVKGRLENLTTGSPFPLKLIAYFPAIRGIETEQSLHNQFNHLKLQGEWFEGSKELVEYVQFEHQKFLDILQQINAGKNKWGNARNESTRLERIRSAENSAFRQFQSASLEKIFAPEVPPPNEDQIASVTLTDAENETIERVFNKCWTISPKQVSEMTHINEQEVKAFTANGIFPCVKLSKQTYVYNKEHIAHILKIVREKLYCKQL